MDLNQECLTSKPMLVSTTLHRSHKMEVEDWVVCGSRGRWCLGMAGRSRVECR